MQTRKLSDSYLPQTATFGSRGDLRTLGKQNLGAHLGGRPGCSARAQTLKFRGHTASPDHPTASHPGTPSGGRTRGTRLCQVRGRLAVFRPRGKSPARDANGEARPPRAPPGLRRRVGTALRARAGPGAAPSAPGVAAPPGCTSARQPRRRPAPHRAGGGRERALQLRAAARLGEPGAGRPLAGGAARRVGARRRGGRGCRWCEDGGRGLREPGDAEPGKTW